MSLSSFWGGRLRATRLSFFYIAGLAFWYGMKSYWIVPPVATKPIVTTESNVPSVKPITKSKCVRGDFTYNPKTHTPQPRNTDKPETCNKEEKSID